MRKFCSRCGESLVEAEVVKRPWWKKLLPRRGPKVVKTSDRQGGSAGQGIDVRHGLRKAFRRARLVLALLVLVAGLAYGAVPSLRAAVNHKFETDKTKVITAVRPTYVPVHPTHVTANMFIAGHPGQLAADEFTNTYWLSPWNPSNEPMLTLTFGEKVTLKEVILYSGVAANYTAYGRPAALHLVFSNGNSDTIMPQDTDKPQTLAISGATGITSVEFQISSVYPGSSGSNVAITEIELFSLQL